MTMQKLAPTRLLHSGALRAAIYPELQVYVMEFAHGDTVTRMDSWGNPLGAFISRGCIVTLPDKHLSASESDPWFPPDENHWPDQYQAGPDGVTWVCLNAARPGFTAQPLTVHGTATVPAGTGVVLARGSLILGGELGDYFRTGDGAVEVAGEAVLLLVS